MCGICITYESDVGKGQWHAVTLVGPLRALELINNQSTSNKKKFNAYIYCRKKESALKNLYCKHNLWDNLPSAAVCTLPASNIVHE